MSLVNIKGTPTIVWGTGSVLGGPNGLAGAVVDSIQLTPKNAEPIEIEGNDGTAANLVVLLDGFNAKASVMYDASKTYPLEGANATITIPYGGATGNAVPFGAGSANQGSAANGVATYTVLVASGSPAFKKKGELMVDFNLVYRPNVAV